MTFPVKLPSSECHKNSLMINQHLLRQCLGAVRQQAITWTSVDQVLWQHTVSLDHNELICSAFFRCWHYFHFASYNFTYTVAFSHRYHSEIINICCRKMNNCCKKFPAQILYQRLHELKCNVNVKTSDDSHQGIIQHHYDFLTWKCFLHYWPFVCLCVCVGGGGGEPLDSSGFP